jgi:uncharacterized OB-fold protein
MTDGAERKMLPTPAPVVTPETRPYWEGAAEGRLMLQRCANCTSVVWYPRGLCPKCGRLSLDWFTATGNGTVYSYTVNRRGAGDYARRAPFVLAYVELEEGPRVLTNVVNCDPESVRIGDPVRAVFHPTGAGSALVRFEPA